MDTTRRWDAVRSWSFPASTAAVSLARNAIAEHVDQLGFSARREDVRLLVSELVTNAVIHAAGGCEVTVRIADDCLRIEVADHSHRTIDLQPQTLTRTNGRGLFIVQTLADSWGVDHHAGGKAVWFQLARPLY